jgi:hypothetical protein
VRILPFVVLLLPNQMNERVLQSDFSVLKGPIRRQNVRAKQVISHCLTAPLSINHKDSQMLLRNIRESKTASAISFSAKLSAKLKKPLPKQIAREMSHCAML